MIKNAIFSISLILILALAFGLVGACSGPAASPTDNSTTNATTPTVTQTPVAVTTVETITLVFNDFEPANSFWDTEFARPWFAELEKRTNGRVKVEAHFGGEIAGLFDSYDAINKGTVDFGKILPTFYADKFPMDGSLIFGPVNQICHRPTQLYYDLYNTFPEWQASYANTPLLALAPMPCTGFFTTKNHAVAKLEDMKGVKVPGPGPAAESRLKAVQAVPVSLQPSETYMALKTGTLGGIAAALRSAVDFGWVDALTNVSEVNLNGSPWAYVMNKKTWDSLPPDIQKIMIDMTPWLIELNENVQAKIDREAKALLIEKGIIFTEVTQAERDRWAVVDNPTLDAYIAEYVTAKGLPGDKLKSEFYRLWEKYSAAEYEIK